MPWRRRIFAARDVTLSMTPPVPLPPGWRYRGDPALLDLPRLLLPCSAANKTPIGADPWLQQLAQAVPAGCEASFTILAGDAPLPLALTARLAARHAASAILLTGSPGCDPAAYGFDPTRAAIIEPELPARSPKHHWPTRDALAWELADAIWPIHIRPGGRWDACLNSSADSRLSHDFRSPWRRPGAPASIELPPLCDREGDTTGWLVHWTRRAYGPWPGEPLGDFLDAILAAQSGWPRDAAATLCRILAEGVIRASTFRSADREPVVSFTAATPAAMRANFSWCARKAAPMWEPWGIAVRPAALAHLGGAPVAYSTTRAVPEWRRHSGGSFTGEAEWRHRSDLQLSALPAGSWTALIPAAASLAALTLAAHSPVMTWAKWVETGRRDLTSGSGQVH